MTRGTDGAPVTAGAILGAYRANESEYLLVNAAGTLTAGEALFSGGFEDYLFLYLDRGGLLLRGSRMNASQAALLPPGTPLSLVPDPGQPITLYWARFTGFGVASLLAVCRFENAAPTDTRASDSAVGEFLLTIKEALHSEYCFRISAAARLTALMVAFCGNKGATPMPTPGQKEPAERIKADSAGGRLAVSLDFIHEKFREDITLEQLSELSGLSVSRYRTIFRKQLGCPPLDYIIRLRINRAKELIAEGGMSMTEIAAAAGCRDSLYFSRLFKKRTGVTPSEYKPRRD